MHLLKLPLRKPTFRALLDSNTGVLLSECPIKGNMRGQADDRAASRFPGNAAGASLSAESEMGYFCSARPSVISESWAEGSRRRIPFPQGSTFSLYITLLHGLEDLSLRLFPDPVTTQDEAVDPSCLLKNQEAASCEQLPSPLLQHLALEGQFGSQTCSG